MPAESRSVVVRLSMDTAQAIRDSQQFGSEFERAMGQAQRSASGADQALDKIGGTAGRIALGATAALGAMGKAAVDWESQWAGVSKTVDGTVSEMAELEDELRELARTMPATHEEIAATAEAAGQLGVAREDVADFTETMLQLGETTNLTADEAATSIAQMANVLGTSQDDIDNVGAALVALGNDGASTEAQILGMAQRISGAGAQIGLAESDILAIANAAASMGVEVEAGGSAISRVFTEMAKATAQGGGDLERFAAVADMSAQQFVQAFESDPARAFSAFTGGLDRINKSGGDVFTTLEQLQLSDVRVSQALLGMAASGDLLTDSLDLGAEAFEENTALAEEYAKRAETTASEVQVAWNNIKDAGIEAGEALLPVISQVADVVADLAGAFGSLPGPAQSAVVELLAVTAVVGGAAWFGTKAIRGVTSTRDALSDLASWSPRAANGLERVAKAGVGLAAVGAAISAITEAVAEASGANLDLSNLARDVQQIANGQTNDLLDRAVEDIKITSDGMIQAGEYLFEAVGALPFIPNETGLDKAQDNIKAIDQELAGLVESGNADAARTVFESIVAVLNGLPAGASVSQQAIDDVMGSFSSYETALANAEVEAEKAADASKSHAGAVAESGQAAELTAEQIKGLIEAMRDQTNAAIDAFDAETGWRRALEAARDAAADNSAGIKGNSDAALENRDAISDLASAWNAQSDVVRNNEARFKAARKAFIDTAEGMGVSREEARRLADQMLALPDSKIIPVELPGISIAQQQLQGIRSEIDSIDRNIDVFVNVRAPSASGFGAQVGFTSAYGNLAFYAGGDIANAHQPELYRGGVTRVWGEPETGGEAYIPLRNDARRPRARAIATETVRLLGGTAHFAEGGTTGGARIPNTSNLSGINRGFLSAAEMAERLSNLTMWQIAALGEDMEGLGKGPLKKLGRAFELYAEAQEKEFRAELRRAEKKVEQEREEQELQREILDARRDELRALKEAQAAYADQVSGNFRSDIFGGGIDTSGLYGSDRWNAVGEAAVGLLTDDTRRAGSFEYLLRELTDLGLDGTAFEQLAASGNSDMARYLIGLGESGIGSFEQDFAARQERLNSLGQYAGTQVFGLQIDAAAVAAREQTEILREQRDIARRAEAKADRIERRMEQFSNKFDRIEQAAGERGPKAFAAAVQGAVSQGRRQGGRP